jgi:N-acylglucosamine-6-phosphate 2-epimerase
MNLKKLKHQLIVSCQALENEPLHSPFIMGRMSIAAQEGGACGIRANSVEDIIEIQKQVTLPVIGIIKKDYHDSPIYITPTLKEIKALIFATSAEIIALDATQRIRPHHEKVSDLLRYIHQNGRLAMADVSNGEEGVEADRLGFDLISTTLSGYTEYTEKLDHPDFGLIRELSNRVDIPIIMEGHTQEPADVVKAFECGAYAAVVGGAITRPQQITHHFTERIKKYINK